MAKRPVIGIMPGYDKEKNNIYTSADYVDGVISAGGMPFVLPLVLAPGMAGQIIAACDGFLFTGGPDLDARYYGEENCKCQGSISPHRDKLELELARLAIRENKAVLGICRGIQLLNAAMGGTLYQDICSGRDAAVSLKHWQDAPNWYPVHDVDIYPGSRLHEIFGVNRLPVNSYHHQAVREPAGGLNVSAEASDGIIEAVESKDERFILGVQWHPELMWKNEPQQLKLFKALTHAAAAGSKRRG